MTGFSFEVPPWLPAWERALPARFADDEAAMRAAVEAAALNVRNGTGGPFGAVIAARDTGEPLAVGVNLVVSAGSSVLHAEVVAILRAQRRGGFHRVGGRAGVPATLFTSAEPCAMCMGAIPWSGLSRVVCGATDADVRGIGFDEGDKPAGWAAAYERRGILVRAGVLRAEAAGVLRGYREAGGAVY